jgi:hypothetical protein
VCVIPHVSTPGVSAKKTKREKDGTEFEKLQTGKIVVPKTPVGGPIVFLLVSPDDPGG